MAELNDILTNFPEEIIQNTFSGKIITGAVNWENKPILLKAEQIETNQILFSHNTSPLRVSISNKDFSGNETDSNREVHSLFWLTNLKGDEIEIKYLPCGINQSFTESLEIGFGDNISFWLTRMSRLRKYQII